MTTLRVGLKARHGRRGLPPAARVVSRVAVYVLMAAGIVVTVFPFLVSLTTSLKPDRYAYAYPPTLWSPVWTLKNYVDAWRAASFSTYMRTTVIYSVVTAVSATLTSALGGYAFGRMRFPGRDKLFLIVLAVMMIPGSVTLIPLFYLMVHWPLVGGNNILGQGGHGFYNSWGGLLLPGLFGPSTIFLMRQFFRTLPRELEDAARMDGCGELGIWWRIMLPLAQAALITVGLFQFSDSWNAFTWPLVIARSPRFYTLQVGLYVFSLPDQVRKPAIEQAAAVMIIVPLVALYLFGQRYFVKGIALTGLK